MKRRNPNTGELENASEVESGSSSTKDMDGKKSGPKFFSVFNRQKKTVHLIRHGHTTYKEGPFRTKCGRYPFDVILSPSGIEQACALKAKLDCLAAEVILTSPLTRALETLHCAMDFTQGNGAGAGRIEVCDLHTEHVLTSGDVGRPASILSEEFRMLSFAGLKEVWWYSPNRAPNDPLTGVFQSRESMDHLRKRVGSFREFLFSRPESVIVVIGHSTFFKKAYERCTQS